MLKETLQKLGLTAEQIDEATKAHEAAVKVALDTALENHVPKTKLDEAIAENGQLVKTLSERDNQLRELQSTAGNSDNLKKQLDEAIAKNVADSNAAATELANYKKNNALDLAIIKAGAKNPKAVKALLNTDRISVDGENLIGLNEQLEALKTSDAYLFGEGSGLSGRSPSAGSSGADTNEPKDNPFKKETFNLTQQAAIYKKDPEQAKRLAAAAGVKPSWLV